MPSSSVRNGVLVFDSNSNSNTVSSATLHRQRSLFARFDLIILISIWALVLKTAWPALFYEWSRPPEVNDSTSLNTTPNTINDSYEKYRQQQLTSIGDIEEDNDYDMMRRSRSMSSSSSSSSSSSMSSSSFEHMTPPPLISTIVMFLIPFLVAITVIMQLAPYWSVRWRVWTQYTAVPEDDIETAHWVNVRTSRGKKQQICKLQKEGTEITIMFQMKKYFYHNHDEKTRKRGYGRGYFAPTTEPLELTIRHYKKWKGLSTDDVFEAQGSYGNNFFDIPIPSFGELYYEHAIAPFFVFQVFCVLLWCLDEYWYYSIMTLVMLVFLEGTLVKRRQKNLEDVKAMRQKPFPIYVMRNGKWEQHSTDFVYPGDIVSLMRSQGEAVCPADMLVLDGSAVVNEALLTGESVPQIKEAVEPVVSIDEHLSINKDHKRSVVFGGTKVIQVHASDEDFTAPDGGCVCYVLRTGFNTSQGDLVKTILFNSESASMNQGEAMAFIGFLLVFAIAAAAYVLDHGLQDPSRSRYKLMLNCIMIVTSVVPPELPMELSMAVNSSLMQLARSAIFCTEPSRIPAAGTIDVTAFDKTGTLTSDSFVVKGVAGLDSSTNLLSLTEVPDNVRYVLTGCNALVNIDGKLVGDPLEIAAFSAAKFELKGDISSGPLSDGKTARLQVVHRFPFSSTLKRMACAVSLQHEKGSRMIAVVKGAAEALRDRFKTVPEYFDEVNNTYSQRGCRVLALGYKFLNCDRFGAKHMARDAIENDLEFAGFLILEVPMKPDSAAAVQHLLESMHHVIVITGDHALTACAVARDLQIAQRPVLVLNHIADKDDDTSDAYEWQSIDGETHKPIASDMISLLRSWDLCVTGDGLNWAEAHLSQRLFRELVRSAVVFARTSPDQKEHIIRTLREQSLRVLMCGDGTNDVGALKQADVGVALISSAEPEKKGIAANQLTTSARKPQVKVPPKPVNEMTKDELRAWQKSQLNDLLNSLDDDQPGIARLGDASIASPFTSKRPYITSAIDIIRQGRCTLITTLQMFSILGVNCLMSAYSMSVLYLDGVKYGDYQMTLSGLSIGIFFMFLAHSAPLDRLAPEKPQTRIFTWHMIVSLLGQWAIHMFFLITATTATEPYVPTGHEDRVVEKTFQPNLLNTVVFIMSNINTVVTFACNYRGEPFMVPLSENGKLHKSLIAVFLLMLTLTSGYFPELNSWWQIVEMPSEDFRMFFLILIIGDVLLTYAFVLLMNRLARSSNQRLCGEFSHPFQTLEHQQLVQHAEKLRRKQVKSIIAERQRIMFKEMLEARKRGQSITPQPFYINPFSVLAIGNPIAEQYIRHAKLVFERVSNREAAL